MHKVLLVGLIVGILMIACNDNRDFSDEAGNENRLKAFELCQSRIIRKYLLDEEKTKFIDSYSDSSVVEVDTAENVYLVNTIFINDEIGRVECECLMVSDGENWWSEYITLDTIGSIKAIGVINQDDVRR